MVQNEIQGPLPTLMHEETIRETADPQWNAFLCLSPDLLQKQTQRNCFCISFSYFCTSVWGNFTVPILATAKLDILSSLYPKCLFHTGVQYLCGPPASRENQQLAHFSGPPTKKDGALCSWVSCWVWGTGGKSEMKTTVLHDGEKNLMFEE